MVDLISSVKRLAAFLVGIVILAVSTVTLFVLFVAQPINTPVIIEQIFATIIVLCFGTAALLLLSRIKTLLAPRISLPAATLIQYAAMSVAFLVIVFWIMWILVPDVSPQTFLTSAGIISITAGLVISTFVGGILSGALVFTTYRFKVGDQVIINNIPGTIKEMTPLVMRIRTDTGHISIPNSAIASGAVIVTAIHEIHTDEESRLPYKLGDRVVTSYMNEQGVIKELTPYHTIVRLDSGREIRFLNTSVMTGATAVAKITKPVADGASQIN